MTLLSNLYSNYITNAVLKTEVDTKGDLLVASGENSVSILPASSDRKVLLADSSTTTGLRWGLFERPFYDFGTTTQVGDTYTFNPTSYECYRLQVAHTTTIEPAASSNFTDDVLYRVIFYIVNGNTATITWGSAIKWSGGTPPTFTTTGTDMLVFTTIDAGTSWQGSTAGLDYS